MVTGARLGELSPVDLYFFSVLEIDADGFWSAAAQAVDEIGEADLAGAAEALAGDNRLNFRNARVEVAVDDDVIVFRPVAHFSGGFPHARGAGRGAGLAGVPGPAPAATPRRAA